MAVFLFPENPSNGQIVTNDETGTKYIYQSQYNKWMVALKQPSTSFVDIAGDTMTGPLDIAPADPILGTPPEPTLKIAASPFRDLGSSPDSNFVSTVLRAVDVDDHTLLSLTNTDADNIPIVQGKRSAFRCYTAESLFGITSNQYDVPDGGAEAGFAITGPTATNVSSSAKVLTAFYASDGSGSAVRYYGRSVGENDLVTKNYVDTVASQMGIDAAYLPLDGSEPMTGQLSIDISSGDALNVNSGNFKIGKTGSINMKAGQTITGGNFNCDIGNISAKQGPDNEDGTSQSNGRLYTKKSSGDIGFTAFPSGNIGIGQYISFSAGSYNNKIIQGYNASDPVFQFKLGATAGATTEVARIGLTGSKFTGDLEVTGESRFSNDLFLDNGSTEIWSYGDNNSGVSFEVGTNDTIESCERILQIANDGVTIYKGTFNSQLINANGPVSITGTLDVTENVTFDAQLNIGGKFSCSNGGTFGGTSGGTIDYMFNGGTVTFMNSGVKNYSGLWQQNKDTNYLLGNQKKLTFFPDTETESYSGDPVDPILILNGKSKLTEVRMKLVIPQKISISAEADGTNINSFLNLGSEGHFTYQVNDQTTWSQSNTVLYIGKDGLVSYKNITMIQNKKITGLGTCTASTDAANKAYVDGTVSTVHGTLKTQIYTAVNNSTDFASLKAELLAALA